MEIQTHPTVWSLLLQSDFVLKKNKSEMETLIAFMEAYQSLWWSICPSIPPFSGLLVGQAVEIFAKSDQNPITAPAHLNVFDAVD